MSLISFGASRPVERPVSSPPVPSELRTERLHLRRWREADAALLAPVLEANRDHLRWIPEHVAAPAPVDALALRLAAFADDFDAGRAWRFGIFPGEGGEVLGEVSLFSRSATGRVVVTAADRLEIGYWLREDATRRGYATEAAAAMLALAERLPGMIRVEIRCDPRNAPSAAVPKRLGFRLAVGARGDAAGEAEEMLWVRNL